jgi:hypothetical protein
MSDGNSFRSDTTSPFLSKDCRSDSCQPILAQKNVARLALVFAMEDGR